ncbi:SAUR-like auxin-responsive protein family [Striga asiatica]|uniref:SAUR-like auxin-responsive protein family n=1 Tax=Striga asiatica TaxID=4170 RepID=A0A5A7QX56_STRAF|nr:SAUR-like auxin-responsive protein family [Striga asiatica]
MENLFTFGILPGYQEFPIAYLRNSTIHLLIWIKYKTFWTPHGEAGTLTSLTAVSTPGMLETGRLWRSGSPLLSCLSRRSQAQDCPGTSRALCIALAEIFSSSSAFFSFLLGTYSVCSPILPSGLIVWLIAELNIGI